MKRITSWRLILLALYFSAPVLAQQTLYLGSTFSPPLSNAEQTGVLDKLAREAFSRTGHNVIIVPLPGERSLINASTGIDDGDLSRIDNIEQRYPELIKVPEKIFDFDFMVFSTNRSVRVQSWADLEPYSIALIKGWKILEDASRNTVMVNSVENAENLFNMLQKNRVDLVLYERLEGVAIIRQAGMDNIHMIEPPLASRPMFIYLNKRHAALIPEITEALRTMKQQGVYDHIIHETLEQSLDGT